MTQAFKIGISTTVLREHPVSYALDRIAGAGYTAAEIWTWHLDQTGERPADLAHQANRLGLTLTVHAPTEGMNPISTDPMIAAQSRRRVREAVRTARILNARAIAVHPGRRVNDDDASESAWERLIPWVAELDEFAARLEVNVGLELMERLPHELFMRPKDAARLMQLPFEHVGLTVDLAHLNTHGDPLKLLSRLDPEWISHVHLSDNSPERVHLPLGQGILDVGVVLEAVARFYRGVVSIEGSIPGQGETLLLNNMTFLRKLGFG